MFRAKPFVSGMLVCTVAALVASGCGALSAAEAAGSAPTTSPMAQAKALMKDGHPDQAVELLEAWLADHPDDKPAQKVLLNAKIAGKELELRRTLNEQSGDGTTPASDAEYERLKDDLDQERKDRLEVAEYYLYQRRYEESVKACNTILADHPDDPATLTLKYRALDLIAKRQREDLERDREYRQNDSALLSTSKLRFPKAKDQMKRQVFVFQEDLNEAEREKVRARLQDKISLTIDNQPVGEVILTLFKLGSLNYVILDDAIEQKKVTLHLVDATIESALGAVSKLVKIRFSYTDGTVFVTSDENEGLVTDIIRLRSGLTDVGNKPSSSSLDTSGSGGGSSASSSSGRGGMNSPYGGMNGQNGQFGGNPFGNQGAPQAPTPDAGGGDSAGGGASSGAGGSDLEKFLGKIPELVPGWPEKGKWHLDRKSNTLFVHATPYAIQEVKRLLEAIDYNNAQVLIEARFLEVGEDAQNQLGFSWQAASTNGLVTGTLNPIDAGTNSNLAQGAASMSGSGTMVFGKMALTAKIQALEQEHKLDTLAEPKILTLNNSTGLIELTKDIQYISSYENVGSGYYPQGTNSSSLNNNYYNQPSLVPVFTKDKEGYSLTIVPSLARNSDVITLWLKPKVKEMTAGPVDVKFTSGSSSDGTPLENTTSRPPEFAERTLTTVLHVQNGQTVALGGLSLGRTENTETGVPFFSHIPLLGFFFKNSSKVQARRNLIILVTATIVDPSGAKVGDEISRLRDTARVLLPAGPLPGEKGREIGAPAGPASEPVPGSAIRPGSDLDH